MNRISINLATGRPSGETLNIASPAVIIIFGLIFLWHTGTRAYTLRQEAERVSRKVTELSSRTGKPAVRKDIEKAGIAAAAEIIEERKFSWIEALDNLEKALPQNVSLASVQPSFKDRSIRLIGYSKDFADLSRFIDNLAALKVYRRVLLANHSTKVIEDGKEAILFNINIEGGK